MGSFVTGDVIALRTGDAVPVDGVIAEGFGTVDQQTLTGEAQPAEKETGDTVLASTLLVFLGLALVASGLTGLSSRQLAQQGWAWLAYEAVFFGLLGVVFWLASLSSRPDWQPKAKKRVQS